MPQLFNTRGPTDLGSISSFINSYQTPEAAERDLFFNAPQGRRYLDDRYQALTGDPFASPIEDAKKARYRAAMTAAQEGASVAVGGSNGPQLLSAPDAPIQGPARNGEVATLQQPTNVEGRPMSRFAARQAGNSAITGMMQAGGSAYKLAGDDLKVPDVNDNNFLDVLGKRAALTGSTDLFNKIQRKNPSALRDISPPDPSDPFLLRGQNKKVIGQDVLHRVTSDPDFQEAYRRDPSKAKALYAAVTNGRDLETDKTAQGQLMVDQTNERKKILEGIKNPVADPVTGKISHIVEHTDTLTGKIVQERVDLTPYQQAVIDKQGGFGGMTGVDVPGRKGIPQLQGTTPEEHALYQATTQQVLAKNPSMPPTQAAQIAHAMLLKKQKEGTAQTSASGVGVRDVLDFMTPSEDFAQFGANALGRISNGINSLMGGHRADYPVERSPKFTQQENDALMRMMQERDQENRVFTSHSMR